MKTSIYHITFFDANKSLYIQFHNCNFRCLGCIRRLGIWDSHLSREIRDTLMSFYRDVENVYLSIDALRSIALYTKDFLDARIAILGGGEPTADKMFREVVEILNSIDMEIRVLTNGYNLDRYIDILGDVDAYIVLSIKSIDRDKHLFYTGRDLDTILKNFVEAYRRGLRISIETIDIPGFNDPSDIEKLAMYISSIDPSIELIIDSYIPVPQTPWERPSATEMLEAGERARKYLKNVYLRGLEISKPIGNILLIHPPLPLKVSPCNK